MFWMKQEKEMPEEMELPEQIAARAEALYRSGQMHCAEAVLASVMEHFKPGVGNDVVHVAAGFGGGSGAGCICGAVSGGTMAFGLVLQDDKRQIKKLTRELHGWFKEQYGVTCCKIILKNHGKVCPTLTGSVAGKVAALLES